MKTARDAPALSAEYHKARKQLMFWSAILLIWSLVGVDLDKAKDAEGGVGAVVKSIKSPQAVPWALVILAVYFAFKFTVEWYQCNAARRSRRASKADFISAWVVFALANILYFGQLISRVQFADVLQGSNRLQSLLLGTVAGFTISYSYASYFVFNKGRSQRSVQQYAKRWMFFTFGTIFFLIPIVVTLVNGSWTLKYLALGSVIGAALAIVLCRYLMRVSRLYLKFQLPEAADKASTEQ